MWYFQMFCISSQCRPNVSSARPEIPSDMNSPDPKLFYVNNQLKMKADRVDFGTGMPLSPDFDNDSPYARASCARASTSGLMASC